MKVLIIYATNSGGTFIASEVVREIFQNRGHRVTILPALEADPDEMARHDLVILGSCSWEYHDEGKRLDGQLQEHFMKFRERAAGKTYPGIQFAVFGLGDSTYSNFCGSIKHLEGFVRELQGSLVGKPLCIDGFFYHQQENIDIICSWAKEIHGLAKKAGK